MKGKIYECGCAELMWSYLHDQRQDLHFRELESGSPVTKLSRFSLGKRSECSVIKLWVAFHNVGMVFGNSVAAMVKPYLIPLS